MLLDQSHKLSRAGDLGIVKPTPEIYRAFTDRFCLLPEVCVCFLQGIHVKIACDQVFIEHAKLLSGGRILITSISKF